MVGQYVADEDENGEKVMYSSQDPDHLLGAFIAAHVWNGTGEIKV